MLEKRSKHIEELAKSEPAVARQFLASEEERLLSIGEARDPLCEELHQPIRGLVHKYANRVLCLLTAECASYCRFCTRRRMVSDVEQGRMTEDDIERWVGYISSRPEVKEVIISGGDPLVVSEDLFSFAIKKLSSPETVKVLRVGTRVPVSDPALLTESKLESIASAVQPVYVGIHFEHPAEITPETVSACERLRKVGAILYSQTVFLAGVNDDYDVLYELFSRLIEIGVRPYYLYRCDPVEGAGHFRVDFEKEREIATKLRANLSGLACPTYVIDSPNGNGKIPVPLGFWEVDYSRYHDFQGDEHEVEPDVLANCRFAGIHSL
jgi:lysine 2,3-aminomutase